MGGLESDSPTPAYKILDKDELSMQFDRSITFVRNYTQHIERDFAQPLAKVCFAYSQRRPISAVFIGFFVLLSFLPIVSFIGVSLLTIAVLTTIALGAAFIASAGIVMGLLAVLLSILVATFFTSVCLSLVAIATFLSLRLLILLRREGAPGFSYWLGEVTGLAKGRQSRSAAPQSTPGVVKQTSVSASEDPLSDTMTESSIHTQQNDDKISNKYEDQFDHNTGIELGSQ